MTAGRFLLGVSRCALAVTLSACGSGSEKPDSPRAINLGFIPKTSSNLVFKMGNDGAQFAARSLGFEDGIELKVEYLASPDLDPAVERQLVRDGIAQKKDGLIVSCLDESLNGPINEAVAAGIPVITYDSDCPNSDRLGFYSMVTEDTGIKGADLLVSAMGEGPKTVAILTGRAGADNLERRVSAFTDRLTATYPDVSVVTTARCMETAESCESAVEDDIISQYPELDGLFVIGLWGLAGACTCSESGMECQCEDAQMPKWKAAGKGKLKTVAYDSLPFELQLMEQGYVSALVGQKYFGWGYDTVSLMYQHLEKGRSMDAFIDSGFDVVCPNNAKNMQAKWDAADFSTPLKPVCNL